jgi:hypothetical protein
MIYVYLVHVMHKLYCDRLAGHQHRHVHSTEVRRSGFHRTVNG